MSRDCKLSRLIALPWELRRPIIVEVLQRGRESLPSFNRKLMESRVRLRNCFDEHFPGVTNFYVPRHKSRYLHGNGLQATNRQLRYETNLLIQEELTAGDVPFVLDVMVVKDIGVFPTWMSFPFRSLHINALTINIRIVRPGTSVVPDEWVEAARYEQEELYSRGGYSPTIWHVTTMAVILYAFGCFSVKADPAQPLIKRTAAGEGLPSATKSTAEKAKKMNKPSAAAKAKLLDFASHQSDIVNSYILPSASYVADTLFINFKDYEYDINNIPVAPSDEDHSKKSRFYKEGCIQFGRDVFRDFSTWYKDDQAGDEQHLINPGQYACYQLQDVLTNLFWTRRMSDIRQSAYGPYLNLLARSAGEVCCSGCRGALFGLLERYLSGWMNAEYDATAQLDPEGYSNATIERDLASELASAAPREELIDDLRLLQIRRSHGWVHENDWD